MVYMTFRASCAYAGVANLLALEGFDITDRELALSMGLPCLFAKEEGCYLAGPMLQSAKWFDLALLPLGFCLKETAVDREEVCSRLQSGGAAMLGLRVGPESKHAVVFTGMEGERFRFLNNKRADSPEPEVLVLSGPELMERLDSRVTAARLRMTEPELVDLSPVLAESGAVLSDLREDIHVFCGAERSPEEQRGAMNDLFRAILLDGITMLELLGEENIRSRLVQVQSQLLAMVRSKACVRPDECLDLALLDSAIAEYIALIEEQI